MSGIGSSLKRWSWRLIKVLAAAAVLGGIVYWLKFAPVAVSVHQVERGDIVAEVLGTGTLEAHYKSTISPRIPGRLQEVLVDMGDTVKAGQVLAKLDEVELKPQLEMAQAGVASAQAALARLEADRAQAATILTQAQANQVRVAKLAEAKASSVEEVEKAQESLGVARAGVSRAEAALAEGQKQIAVAERTRAYHQARLADAVLCAPFDGLIVQRARDPGDIAVPGTGVLSLVSTQELWITAWVDETEMSRVAVGQPARAVFRSEPDHDYRGEVARLGRQADRETREFAVDVRVLELPKNWAVGQRAEVYIQTARQAGVLLLPASCVLWRHEKPGVFVRRGQSAAWRELKLGLSGREKIEVAAGLEPGEEVVIPADGKTTALEGRRLAVP